MITIKEIKEYIIERQKELQEGIDHIMRDGSVTEQNKLLLEKMYSGQKDGMQRILEYLEYSENQTKTTLVMIQYANAQPQLIALDSKQYPNEEQIEKFIEGLEPEVNWEEDSFYAVRMDELETVDLDKALNT